MSSSASDRLTLYNNVLTDVARPFFKKVRLAIYLLNRQYLQKAQNNKNYDKLTQI